MLEKEASNGKVETAEAVVIDVRGFAVELKSTEDNILDTEELLDASSSPNPLDVEAI